MRIALLNPPVPGRAFTNRDLMGGMGIDDAFGVGLGPRFVALLKYEGIRMPVISLAYAAAILRRAGHDVAVFDQMRCDPDEAGVAEAVIAWQPEWVVVATSFAWLGAELRYLARLHAATGCRRLLTGYTATHFARGILERGLCDVVSSGDPEVAVGHLAAGTLAPGLPGVWMRAEDTAELTTDAQIRRTRVALAADGFLDDLDALPGPDWRGFPIPDYGYHPLLKQRPFLTMLSSRGCPYVCNFCPYPVGQGAPFRARSALHVVAEMAGLVQAHGVRAILFRDPTFSLDIERSKAICREVLRSGLKVDWGIETRLDRLDDELIDLLGQAGCRSCEFGVDPLDADTQKASHRKPIGATLAAERIRRMERAGIATAGLFVVGVPGQDEDEMRRTIDWIETIDISYMNYEVATPFPGTPLYQEAVERGWTQPIALDALLAGDPKLGFNGVMDVERMKALQDEALSRFYVQPKKVASEVFTRDFWLNVRFLAGASWTFVKGELAR